jgi:hypothetical protein
MKKVTALQRLIMFALSIHGQMPITRLVDYTGSTSSSMPIVLREMVAEGYVTCVTKLPTPIYALAAHLTPIATNSLIALPVELLTPNTEPAN